MPRVSKPKPGEPIRITETKGGVRYRAVIDVGKAPRRQATRTFDSLAAARAWVDATRSEVRDGTHVRSSDLTLAELAEQWIASRLDVREVTRAGYRMSLRPVLARLGKRKAQSITPEDVVALLVWMSNEGGVRGNHELSRRSVVYGRSTLKQVFDYAVRTGLVRSNPVSDVKPPRKRRGDTREKLTWSPQQLRAFVAAGDRDAEQSHVWRLLGCGLRRSELLGLEWPQVDLEAGTVTITQGRVRVGQGRMATDDPKSEASWRTVWVEQLHPGTKALLRAAYLRAEDKTGLVVRDADGHPMTVDAFRAAFTRVCIAANVPVVRPHLVRHTLAVIGHEAGIPPLNVAAMLGHTLETHLRHYLPASDAGVQSASLGLGAALAAAQG